MRPMPKTFHDVLLKENPAFVRDAREAAHGIKRDSSWDRLAISKESYRAEYESVVGNEFQRYVVNPHHPRHASEAAYHAWLKSPGVKAVINQISILAIALINQHLFDDRAFFVAPHLAKALAETDVNAPFESILPPFPACRFVFDDPAMREAMTTATGYPATETGQILVYVALQDRGADQRTMAVTALLCDGANPPLIVLSNHFPFVAGMTIEDTLSGTSRQISEHDSQFYQPRMQKFFRIILNLMLYISAPNPDLSEPLHACDRIAEAGIVGYDTMSRKQRRAASAAFTQHPYIELGGKMASLAGETTATGQPLEQRILVRGHWRHQACGPKLSERKWIIVWPYYKGPDGEAPQAKPYLVS